MARARRSATPTRRSAEAIGSMNPDQGFSQQPWTPVSSEYADGTLTLSLNGHVKETHKVVSDIPNALRIARLILNASWPARWTNPYYFMPHPDGTVTSRAAPEFSRLAFDFLIDRVTKDAWSFTARELDLAAKSWRRPGVSVTHHHYLDETLFNAQRWSQQVTSRCVVFPHTPIGDYLPLTISPLWLFKNRGDLRSGRIRTAVFEHKACHLDEADARIELAANILNRLVPPCWDNKPMVFVKAGVMSQTAVDHAEGFAQALLAPDVKELPWDAVRPWVHITAAPPAHAPQASADLFE